jgi:hypothetical protein
MRLEIASTKAIRFAIMNYHYSKAVPLCQMSFAVFNMSNEFCGVVCYSIGANNGMAKNFGLPNGAVAELVRIALNGKQESTSKAVSTSIRLLSKKCPLVKLIVSYADSSQSHIGIIYQATNFLFHGYSQASDEYLFRGKQWHGRSFRSQFGSHLKYPDIEIVKGSVKLKYVYPLHKSMIPLCKSLAKPYPKKQAELPHVGEDGAFQPQGAFDSTVPLKTVLKQS